MDGALTLQCIRAEDSGFPNPQRMHLHIHMVGESCLTYIPGGTVDAFSRIMLRVMCGMVAQIVVFFLSTTLEHPQGFYVVKHLAYANIHLYSFYRLELLLEF